jgi:hypothetical protein
MTSRSSASFVTPAFAALALAALGAAAGYWSGAVSLPVAVGAGLGGFVVAMVVLALVSRPPRRDHSRDKPAAATDRGGDGGDASPVIAGAGADTRGTGKGRSADDGTGGKDVSGDADGGAGGGD